MSGIKLRELYVGKFVAYFPTDGEVLFSSWNVADVVLWLESNGYGKAETPEEAFRLPNIEFVPQIEPDVFVFGK